MVSDSINQYFLILKILKAQVSKTWYYNIEISRGKFSGIYYEYFLSLIWHIIVHLFCDFLIVPTKKQFIHWSLHVVNQVPFELRIYDSSGYYRLVEKSLIQWCFTLDYFPDCLQVPCLFSVQTPHMMLVTVRCVLHMTNLQAYAKTNPILLPHHVFSTIWCKESRK